MKKAILPAIITALFATSAQATSLYEANGTAVKMSGEVHAYFATEDAKVDGVTSSEEDGEITAYGKIQLDMSNEVSDNLTALASFEVEANNDEEVEVDDAWVGLKGNFGKISFGETGSSFALMEKTQLSQDLEEYDAIYNDSEGDGKSVRYEKAVGPVAFSANYSFVEGDSDVENDYSVSVDYAISDYTVGAAYNYGGESGTEDITSWGISASAEIADLYVAVTYTDNEYGTLEIGDYEEGDFDFTTAAISASYAFNNTTVYGSYVMLDIDSQAGESVDTDADHMYVGVSYDIAKKIYAFVEYSMTEVDDSIAERDALLAGLVYKF